MNPRIYLIFIALCSGCILSCTRHDTWTSNIPLGDSALPATGCPGILYGIPAMENIPGGHVGEVAIGLSSINKQTGSYTGVLNFGTGSIYANQGTMMDSNYAILLPQNWLGFGALFSTLRYGIPGSGKINDIVMPDCCYALTADHSRHLYYCIVRKYPGPDTLISFQIINNTITARTVLGFFRHWWTSPATVAIDEANNVVYVCAGDVDSNRSSIYQFYPGATAASPVTLISFPENCLIGLQYNSADHSLYGVYYGPYPNLIGKLLKINPSNGSYSVLVTLPDAVNNELYSTTLDACSNRMYISNLWGKVLITVDLATAKTATYHLPYFYQGLAIR